MLYVYIFVCIYIRVFLKHEKQSLTLQARTLKLKEGECDAQCSSSGLDASAVEHISCSRKCVSQLCYTELYASDEVRIEKLSRKLGRIKNM